MESDKKIIGRFSVEYHAVHYDDVQLSAGQIEGVPSDRERKYVLTCSTRIIIYNPDGVLVSPSKQEKIYNNYPILLNMSSSITDSDRNFLNLRLIDYFPKTINTQVQTSGTAGTSSGAVQSSSMSNTVGSSTSETNSFSVSASGFGEAFSMSATMDHSTTSTHEHSVTKGSESSRNSGVEASNSASMSIKDWGAYGLVNPKTAFPIWNFGQEYPWNVFESATTNGATNKHNENQVLLNVPATMLARLTDGGTMLYPPSQLSSYGINFATKVQWLVSIPAGQPPMATFDHYLNYFTASHGFASDQSTKPDDSSRVEVFMDLNPTILGSGDGTMSLTLDLGILALAPVSVKGAAIVGFVPNKFTTLPLPQSGSQLPQKFLSYASANDLIVFDTTQYAGSLTNGTGFSVGLGGMTASLNTGCSQLNFRALFKVIDTIHEYSLFLKHWKIGEKGLKLSLTINNDISNVIVRYIDDLESEGGSNNTTVISLRNLDFSSLDYHDYLNLGLNSIDFVLTSLDGSPVSQYGLRALSIEPN